MIPEPYKQYLIYFHGQRDYFECHEVLEEFWKEDPPKERNIIWVGFIQIAVALYHQRLENFNGANRLLSNAISILGPRKDDVQALGLHHEQLMSLLHKRLEEIRNHESYYSINLPISDKTLLEECILACEKMNANWGAPSDLQNEAIVRKHSLRDRTEVIEEREKEKQRRAKRN